MPFARNWLRREGILFGKLRCLPGGFDAKSCPGWIVDFRKTRFRPYRGASLIRNPLENSGLRAAREGGRRTCAEPARLLLS
jgi:hypothetical protein